jgi:hypothetical protein
LTTRRRIIEGTWTCTSCGSSGIPGRHKTCPSCGNPRDEARETQFDFGARSASGASDRATVSDPAALAAAAVGPDWHCAYCQTANRGDATVCRSCSAEREARALGPPPPTPAAQGAIAQPLASPPAAAGPPAKRGCARRGCLGLALLLVVAGLFLWWGSRTRETTGRIVAHAWEREILRERFTPVVREGWQDELRAARTVLPVAGRGEVAGVERIRDCQRRQRGTRRVADGTETVCTTKTREVACGTEERCSVRDLGNGYAEEVCTDVTRTCSESYEDCREETRWREEPVYGVSCRYDTWEWQPAGSFRASGGSDPPHWPEVELAAADRAERRERYEVTVAWGDEEAERHTFTVPSAGDFQRWPVGRTVALAVSNFGTVESVLPAEAE